MMGSQWHQLDHMQIVSEQVASDWLKSVVAKWSSISVKTCIVVFLCFAMWCRSTSDIRWKNEVSFDWLRSQ